MNIPRDVSKILGKITASTGAKKVEAKKDPPVTKPVVDVEDDEGALGKTQAARTEAGQWRKKCRTLEVQVNDLTTKLEAATTNAKELEAKLKEAEPRAEQWRKHEHVERTKLLAELPPELKKEAADMSINHLRLFVGKQGGNAGDGKTKSGGKKDENPKTVEELEKMDAKAFNEHFDKVLKGEATPLI